MTDDLITWLRAQLDDDERVARAADSSRWLPEDKGITFEYIADDFHEGEAQARLAADTRANQEHIALHDPARVLAEVDAKRRILGAHGRPHECIQLTGSGDSSVVDGKPWELWEAEHSSDSPAETCWTLRVFALPYADRPGYREEWRP